MIHQGLLPASFCCNLDSIFCLFCVFSFIYKKGGSTEGCRKIKPRFSFTLFYFLFFLLLSFLVFVKWEVKGCVGNRNDFVGKPKRLPTHLLLFLFYLIYLLFLLIYGMLCKKTNALNWEDQSHFYLSLI